MVGLRKVRKYARKSRCRRHRTCVGNQNCEEVLRVMCPMGMLGYEAMLAGRFRCSQFVQQSLMFSGHQWDCEYPVPAASNRHHADKGRWAN